VHGLHGEGMAKHEGDPFSGTHIGEPLPGEHAFGRHDEIVAVRGDGLQEHLGIRLDIPVQAHLTSGVEDTDVHRLHVEIDSAIVPMLRL